MRKKELRELQIAVENPNYDRRRKNGADSVEEFKVGTRFLLYFHGEDDGILNGLPADVQMVDKNIWVHGGTLGKLFYASSKVVEPKTFKDLDTMNGVSAEPTLDQLLADGMVTIEQCAAAQEKVQKRWDLEEQLEEAAREKKRQEKLAKTQTTTPTTGSAAS